MHRASLASIHGTAGGGSGQQHQRGRHGGSLLGGGAFGGGGGAAAAGNRSGSSSLLAADAAAGIKSSNNNGGNSKSVNQRPIIEFVPSRSLRTMHTPKHTGGASAFATPTMSHQRQQRSSQKLRARDSTPFTPQERYHQKQSPFLPDLGLSPIQSVTPQQHVAAPHRYNDGNGQVAPEAVASPSRSNAQPHDLLGGGTHAPAFANGRANIVGARGGSMRDASYRGAPMAGSMSAGDGYAATAPPVREIIVFGYPPSSASIVLSLFCRLGEVTQQDSSGTNYCILRYATAASAEMALCQHGKLVDGNMIGVMARRDNRFLSDSEHQPGKGLSDQVPNLSSQHSIFSRTSQNKLAPLQTAGVLVRGSAGLGGVSALATDAPQVAPRGFVQSFFQYVFNW